MKIDAIYSYDFYSESARRLATLLKVPVIRHEKSTFKGNPNKRILNWGSSDLPREVRKCNILNRERAVWGAIRKDWALTILQTHRIPTVPWTEDRDVAIGWLAEGARVFGRKRLTGKDGEGLVEVFINDEITGDIKLFTKFVPSIREYRVTGINHYRDEFHEYVMLGASFQRKVPLDDFTGIVNPDIKTSGNGYGFKWVVRDIPREVERIAGDALRVLELDFGGVDVLWDGRQAWVLEVNTAPELTPNAAQRLAQTLEGLQEPQI